MAYEVEMKVWVTEWDPLRDRLRERFTSLGSVHKEDHYFRPVTDDDPRSYGFRVRRGEGGAAVTFKDRSVVDGVENNVEREFSVGDPDAMIELAGRLGCVEYLSKIKRGEEFTSDNLTIGLFHVEGIGDFLEVEAVVESADEVEAARRDVRKLLRVVGMENARVESRPYAELAEAAREGRL